MELAESTRTSAEAAAAIGTTVAQIAKSLVFLAGEKPVLVIASGVNGISLDKLARQLGTPVGRANADMVKQITGFPIGGVPPVGHVSPMRVLVDKDLLQYPEVWAAAGTPHAVFRIIPAELIRITKEKSLMFERNQIPGSKEPVRNLTMLTKEQVQIFSQDTSAGR